jgi:hypothetical protein
MKKALCLFGQIRRFDAAYFNEFFPDFDIFIHTHHQGTYNDEILKIKRLAMYAVSTCEYEHLPQSIPYESDGVKHNLLPQNVLRMYYSINQTLLSLSLNKNYSTYDLCMLCRSDLMFHHSIDYESLNLSVLNTVDVCRTDDLIPDQFCISHPNNIISVYKNIYYKIHHLIDPKNPINWISEHILKKCVDEVDIDVEYQPYNYNIISGRVDPINGSVMEYFKL